MAPCSGVVLAGGASRRMGTSKANPLLEGRSLLAWQAEKLRILGIQDIMLSGKDCPELPGWSPLGGLYSCFHAAENAHCLVLSVDTPMVPCAALVIFYKAHMAGITLLRCSGEAEPLRVYDTALKRVILPLIKTQRAPVRALSRLVAPAYFMGPEKFLLNCNTPQQF